MTRRFVILVLAVAWTIGVATCQAAWFADHVVNYVPGTAPVDPFNPTGAIFLNDPTAALGKPNPIVPGSPEFEYDGVVYPATPSEPVNPFINHFDGNNLAQIGASGELVLRLERFVEVGDGLELGIFGNVGLANNNFGGGASERQAAADVLGIFQSFGIDAVRIEVSETGLPGSWAEVSTERTTIQNPMLYYSDAAGLQGDDETPASLEPKLSAYTESDFGLPLAGEVTQFNGLTIGQMENLMAGSAGGDWIDLDGLMVDGEPLERVGYVRFFDPESTFELMAVSINSQLAGATVVPEPASLALALIGAGALTWRQRRS